MGKKMVFVCDPHMFPKIYKGNNNTYELYSHYVLDPKLNFVDIKAFIMEKVSDFG
jgi:hypothetical protein